MLAMMTSIQHNASSLVFGYVQPQADSIIYEISSLGTL